MRLKISYLDEAASALHGMFHWIFNSLILRWELLWKASVLMKQHVQAVNFSI